MTHTMYFDRRFGTIEGALTLQMVTENKTILPLFKRLPARSGQSGHTASDNDWERGKGAIPMGSHWLSTKRESLQLSPLGTPFYVISTVQGQRTIDGPNKQYRGNCGLHLENMWPGSAGCIALVCDRKPLMEKAVQLFNTLDYLNLTGVEYIRLVVL